MDNSVFSLLYPFVNRFCDEHQIVRSGSLDLNLRRISPNTEVFLHSLSPRGKADLSKGSWNRKRKLGVTTHFFGDNLATIILKSFKIKNDVFSKN